MKKLSSYLLRHKFGYLFVFVSMVIAVSLDLLTPQVTRVIVDDVIQGGQVSRLRFLLPCILVIGLGRCIFGYTKEYTSDLIGSAIATDIRKDLFTYLQSLSADFFDRNNTGELMSRVKDDIDRIWNALGYVSMLIMEVVFHTCLVLLSMYSLSWRLALIPTAAMIATGVIAVFEERRLGAVYEEISEENAALNTVAEENLAGVRTVKAFAREKFEIKKFLSHNQRYYDLNMKQSKVFVKYYPCFSLITKLLPLIVLLLGGSQVIRGELTLGSLTAFVEYSMNIVWPMEMLGWLSNDFSSSWEATGRSGKFIRPGPPSRSRRSLWCSLLYREKLNLTMYPFIKRTGMRFCMTFPLPWSRERRLASWEPPAREKPPSSSFWNGFTMPPAGPSVWMV